MSDMDARGLVEDALLRLTDGTLTFYIQEDSYSVGAAFKLDGVLHSHAWSKARLAVDPMSIDEGVRVLLSKPNGTHGNAPENDESRPVGRLSDPF